MINGRFEDNYLRIRDYSEELKVSNPGTTTKISLHTPLLNFKRFYVCLDACKRGFLDGCRPMISLDACHLRGFVKGQILAAVGIDANDGMYPIAFAVCEGENYDSWQWFLRLLLIDIKHPPIGAGVWNFISDQQKGLKQALEEVIPEAPTRFCLRHLYANFKNKFKGKALKDLMWAAAKETTEVGFNAKMDQIKVLNKDAYGHLKGIEAEHWSKHKFSQIPKCDMQLNNLCEVFNSKIVEARDKPILTMCEMIRKYLMTRIVKNGEQMANYRGPICPRAQDKLQLNKVEGRDSRTTVCGGNKFEINLHGKQYKVDLERQTCSCFKWELTGIPCCHVVAAILHKKLKPENYVNACYHTSTYLRIYSHLLLPTNGSELWPKALGSIVLPPIFKKQPGRPNKQKRRKDIDEVQNPYKMKKAGYAQKCSLCHQVGHKKQSCKYGQSAGEAHSNPWKGKGKSKATQGRKRQKSGAGHTYDFMGFRLPVDDMVSSQTSEVCSNGPPAQAPAQASAQP